MAIRERDREPKRRERLLDEAGEMILEAPRSAFETQWKFIENRQRDLIFQEFGLKGCDENVSLAHQLSDLDESDSVLLVFMSNRVETVFGNELSLDMSLDLVKRRGDRSPVNHVEQAIFGAAIKRYVFSLGDDADPENVYEGFERLGLLSDLEEVRSDGIWRINKNNWRVTTTEGNSWNLTREEDGKKDVLRVEKEGDRGSERLLEVKEDAQNPRNLNVYIPEDADEVREMVAYYPKALERRLLKGIERKSKIAAQKSPQFDELSFPNRIVKALTEKTDTFIKKVQSVREKWEAQRPAIVGEAAEVRKRVDDEQRKLGMERQNELRDVGLK